MPSARTWWKATISAVRSPSSPVTAVMRQSGRSVGSRVPTTSAAIFSSASSSPGAAHSKDDTWSRTSNRGASTQIGLPQPGGVGTRRWRRRGTERTRSATAARAGRRRARCPLPAPARRRPASARSPRRSPGTPGPRDSPGRSPRCSPRAVSHRTWSTPAPGRTAQSRGLASSSTCWNVGRFVVRIVSGMSPGVKPVRAAGAAPRRGVGALRAPRGCAATWSTAAHSDARHAARSTRCRSSGGGTAPARARRAACAGPCRRTTRPTGCRGRGSRRGRRSGRRTRGRITASAIGFHSASMIVGPASSYWPLLSASRRGRVARAPSRRAVATTCASSAFGAGPPWSTWLTTGHTGERTSSVAARFITLDVVGERHLRSGTG